MPVLKNTKEDLFKSSFFPPWHQAVPHKFRWKKETARVHNKGFSFSLLSASRPRLLRFLLSLHFINMFSCLFNSLILIEVNGLPHLAVYYMSFQRKSCLSPVFCLKIATHFLSPRLDKPLTLEMVQKKEKVMHKSWKGRSYCPLPHNLSKKRKSKERQLMSRF